MAPLPATPASTWHSLLDGYLPVLTVSTLCLLLVCEERQSRGDGQPMRGSGWLRSWGRPSYEIYLSHMFVVFAVVRLFKLSGADYRWGVLWHLLALPLCWLVGVLVERWLSTPCERWLRRRLATPTRIEPTASHPTTAELPVA